MAATKTRAGRTAQADASGDATVSALRRFSRFYTRQLGLLGAGLLDSGFSLSQARVLYELAHQGPLTASTLIQELGLDRGYLSRMLRAFERDGLLSRTPLAADGRSAAIRLTAAGRAAQRRLERSADAQAAALLAGLDPTQRATLAGALRTVQSLLGPRPAAEAPAEASAGSPAGSPAGDRTAAGKVVLRGHRPGDIGWVIHRHGVLYAAEYGWDERFEALVASIGSTLLTRFDPIRERSFIAERDGEILGAAFAVRESDEDLKIRLVYVEPQARGLGIGRRLTEACVAFAREAGYRRVVLWTHRELTAARHIYASVGFRQVSEEVYDGFGLKNLVSENWVLELADTARHPPGRRQNRSSGRR